MSAQDDPALEAILARIRSRAAVLVQSGATVDEVVELINASIPAINAELALRRKIHARGGGKRPVPGAIV